MSGKRLRSFRQGDLAEGMGLEVLRRISLVAPVPRSEDIGVDAVCTLLLRDGHVARAEDTFAIQAKAASVRSLDLDPDDQTWLHAFDLPLFWLSIDLKRAVGALHSFANLFAMTTPPERVLLDWPDGAVGFAAQPWVASLPPTPAAIWVGPPLIEFKFGDIDHEAFATTSYTVLKSHLREFQATLRARRVGVYRGLTWETGGPTCARSLMMQGGDDADLKTAFEVLLPALLRIEMLLDHRRGNGELLSEIGALKAKARSLGLLP